MRPGEIHAAVDLILFEIQHRDVDRTVSQNYAARARVVEPADFLPAKDVFEKVRLFFRVLAGNGEVLYAAHAVVPFVPYAMDVMGRNLREKCTTETPSRAHCAYRDALECLT